MLAGKPPVRVRDRLLARVAVEAVWERDLETGIFNWDSTLESSFGYHRDEVVNHIRWWRERVHPDDLAYAEEVESKAIAGDAAGWSSQYRFRRKDGSWAWVQSQGVIDRDVTGRARLAAGAMIDILKEGAARLRVFTEQIPARALVADSELRVLWDAGAAFPSSPSTVGETVAEFLAGSPDRERILEGCRRALAGQSSTLEVSDGATVAHLQLEPFRHPTGKVIGVAGVAFDITDRVRSEKQLQTGRQLIQQVLDTLPVGVIVLDRAGDILRQNPAAVGIWGKMIASGPERREKSVGFRRGSGQRIATDEWASRAALEEGKTTREELVDIISFGGERKTIKNYAAPIRDSEGTITGAVVVNEDVTERVRAEDALRKTERLLVDAEKLGKTGSWEQDLVSGAVFNTEANRRLFFGDDPSKGEQLEVDDYFAAIHPDDRERVMAARRQLHAGVGRLDIEFRVLRPDGDVRWLFGRATIVRDDSGRPLRAYGTHADITDRKRAEEELGRRAQQLEALSRKLIEAQEAERRAVARELHDDFGQVLTALKLNLHQRGRDDAESIALIDGAIKRMRELAQDLRPPLLDEFGLEASLKWYVEREAKRTGLTFELDIAPLAERAGSVLETTCFRVAQEALTNVVRHADAHVVKIALGKSDGQLQLAVCDDGRGFDVPAARKRANQDGSQGLINMQERVALAGGDLEIDSAPGRGTCIRARLPLAHGT